MMLTYRMKLSKPIKTINLYSFPKTASFVSSIFIISVSFYFFFMQPNDLQPEYAMTPDIPENLSV